MSDSEQKYDPEVIEALEGIRRAGGTSLLRVSGATARMLARDTRGESIAKFGKSANWNKDLIIAHRESVSELLYQAGKELLARNPVEHLRAHRLRIMRRDDWEERGRRLSEVPRCRADSTALKILTSLLGPGITPTGLASQSCALVPGDNARILLALAVHEEGRTSEALAILLEDILAHSCTPEVRANALLNAGYFEYSLGNFEEAKLHYREAADLELSYSPVSAVYWMTTSAITNDEEGVLAAGRVLRDWDDPVGAREAEAILMADRRTSGPGHWSRASTVLLRLSDRLPPIGRRIHNAIA